MQKPCARPVTPRTTPKAIGFLKMLNMFSAVVAGPASTRKLAQASIAWELEAKTPLQQFLHS